MLIEIVKYDGIFNFTDDVLDYAFELAKTLGARAISCEMPSTQVDGTEARRPVRRQAQDDGRLPRPHRRPTPAHWEEAFSYAKYNGANLDIGHFISGNKTSPIPFLKQHHDRITHIHVKDKTLDDKNVPFGKGDTPIKEVAAD